ncbi:helix-turn-helix domain-containing protein [Sulfoacidibacillus thermotolerans]|uniref:Cytoskeleton protein RodZ-like C-terminal domain-containing protein n=1 Tax=Sulfoacidibacillus thermotolerans TaxID=1765684 RepID=A0A2U3DAC2_SULT2|nr:RodZ domain-containing protein [Sulfoacidibacillus thermotolerans]PWI58239.1 hypothetical protein BM613_04745 [Sulfoacidibacillus thermotolerans]
MQENGSGMKRDDFSGSQEALRELGNYLRQTREARGLTLSDVVEATKIRSRYLLAIEEGDLSIMPGIVYARGFIRSYADYLGLDGAKLTAQYLAHRVENGEAQANERTPAIDRYTDAEPIGSRTIGKQTADVKKWSTKQRPLFLSRRWTWQASLGALALLFVALTLIIVVTAAVHQPPARKSMTLFSSSKSHSGVGTKANAGTHHGSTRVPAANAVVLTETQSTPIRATFQVVTGEPLKLSVTAVSGRCWIQVVGDGQMLVTSEILTPGQTVSWTAQHSIQIDAGASRKISMTINGLPVPLAKSAQGGYTYSFVKK